jgi:hypothetical protein
MVRFRDLRPGKYTIEVGHLGVSAAYDQIEIRTRVSSGAKSRLDYRWGEAPTAVQRVSGKLIDIRRQGADIIERLTSAPVETPIRSALIQLRHPNNGSVYTDESDEHGEFGVVGVPNGIYVMHVRGGVTPGDSANFLVQVTPAATKESLQLFRGELCGGTAIQLQP